jgi:hypothetical protein
LKTIIIFEIAPTERKSMKVINGNRLLRYALALLFLGLLPTVSFSGFGHIDVPGTLAQAQLGSLQAINDTHE